MITGESGKSTESTLRRPEVRAVLNRPHKAARGDVWRILPGLPGMAFAYLSGKGDSAAKGHGRARNLYFCISREQGEFLYLVGRALEAKRIVEFGTSFGVSTIYLAAAVCDNGGGLVIGTELEASKQAAATSHLAEAGLGAFSEVRLGDALETLREVPAPIDLVFLDGWKDGYLPVLKLLVPKLRAGVVVLADNIKQFKRTLKPYVDYVQSGENGFESVTLSIGTGFEFSHYRGQDAQRV